ncbi:hypothetical protein WJX81_001456 [Elliptochloris bilobata]|uniref:Protein kinase domain-containing protein n=1 Tax=Elliptochloris bilobata TaxID=381761 RepID=A0AAW1QNF7_9CHLO
MEGPSPAVIAVPGGRCLRPGTDQWEAVKVVRFIRGNRLASCEAAEQEAAILRELSDLPYVLTYHGHIISHRACFLFTELLQGQPMSDVFDDLDEAGLALEQRAVAMPDLAIQLLTV